MHTPHTWREAWPGVEFDIATFSALAANQLDDGPFDVRADDLYLAIACAARIERAIIEFERAGSSSAFAGC